MSLTALQQICSRTRGPGSVIKGADKGQDSKNRPPKSGPLVADFVAPRDRGSGYLHEYFGNIERREAGLQLPAGVHEEITGSVSI
jgi:hypothetical protein